MIEYFSHVAGVDVIWYIKTTTNATVSIIARSQKHGFITECDPNLFNISGLAVPETEATYKAAINLGYPQ